MITIDIPVCDKIIAVNVYVNVDVQLRPLSSPSTRESLGIEQAKVRLNGEIYMAVKSALDNLAHTPKP